MSEMTEAQKNFIMSVRPHVTYTTIGKRHRTARALAEMGYVNIVQGYFAYLTEKGLDFRSSPPNP